MAVSTAPVRYRLSCRVGCRRLNRTRDRGGPDSPWDSRRGGKWKSRLQIHNINEGVDLRSGIHNKCTATIEAKAAERSSLRPTLHRGAFDVSCGLCIFLSARRDRLQLRSVACRSSEDVDVTRTRRSCSGARLWPTVAVAAPPTACGFRLHVAEVEPTRAKTKERSIEHGDRWSRSVSFSGWVSRGHKYPRASP